MLARSLSEYVIPGIFQGLPRVQLDTHWRAALAWDVCVPDSRISRASSCLKSPTLDSVHEDKKTHPDSPPATLIRADLSVIPQNLYSMQFN